MLAPVLVVPPESSPVSLAEAKAHLRITDPDSDAEISAMIDSAVDHLDGWSGVLGRALLPQTWAQSYPRFERVLRLPVGPALSLAGIAYYDAANVERSFAGYSLLADARGAFLLLDPAASPPAAHDRADAVTATYMAGGKCPAAIRAAILLMVAHQFEMRQAVAPQSGGAPVEIPLGVRALLAPYAAKL